MWKKFPVSDSLMDTRYADRFYMPDKTSVKKPNESLSFDNFMQQQFFLIELKRLNVYLIEVGSHWAIVSFNWTTFVACAEFYFGFTHRVWKKKKSCFIKTKILKFTWTPVNRNSTKWSRCFDVNISLCVCLLVYMGNKMYGITIAHGEM